MKWTAYIGSIALLWGALAWNDLAARSAPEPVIDSALTLPYDAMVRDLGASEAFLRTALAHARTLGRTDAYGPLHRSLSIVLGMSGALDSSTHHGLLAVEEFRSRNDRLMLGVMLCDLGHGTKRRDLDRAFAFYREGVPMLEELNARAELTRAYNNYSMLFEMRGDIDSALYFGRKGLALKEALHDSIGLPYGLNRVAQYLLHKERFEEALALTQRADSIRRMRNDTHGMAEQSIFFGDLYAAWNKVDEAIAYFNDAVHGARSVGVPYMEQYAQEQLAQLHERTGDTRSALAATRRAHTIQDSLFNDRNSRTIIELEKRYEVARKDQAIAELKAETTRRKLYIGLSLGALVVLGAGGLVVHQVRQRRLRAERDAAIIAEREAGLRAVFEATEQERRRLSRELHDGVGQQLGGLKHRLQHLTRDGDPEALERTVQLVDDTAREVRDLAHQLMPRALSRVGLVPALQDLLTRTFGAGPVETEFVHTGVPTDLPEALGTGVYRIAQELLSNVLRHAHATRVELQLIRNKGHLMLLVEDNGRGYGAGTTGPGIGLLNIADRARALEGTFTIEAQRSGGTVAIVRVPLPPMNH